MYVYTFDLATRIRGFELKWECLCFYFLGIIERERLRLCLVTVFIFYFQKLVFGNIKKNQFPCIFEIKKHVWLVEIKK